MRYIANFFIFLYNFSLGWFFGKLDYYSKPLNQVDENKATGPNSQPVADLSRNKTQSAATESNGQRQENKQKPDAIIKDTSSEVLTALNQVIPNPLNFTATSEDIEGQVFKFKSAKAANQSKNNTQSPATESNGQPQNNNQKPDAIIQDTTATVLDKLASAFPNPSESKGYEPFEKENNIYLTAFNPGWENATITINNNVIEKLAIDNYDKSHIEAVKTAIQPLLSSVANIRGSNFEDGKEYTITVNVQYIKPGNEKSDRTWHQDEWKEGIYPITSIVYFNHKGTTANLNLAQHVEGSKTYVPLKSINTHTHPSVIFDNNFFAHQVSDIIKTGDDTSVRGLLTIFWGNAYDDDGAIERDPNHSPSIQDLRKNSPRR